VTNSPHSFSERIIINLATLGWVGRFPKMPGTAGSAVGVLWAGLLLWLANETAFGWLGYAVVLVVSIPLSVWICSAAERILKVRDPGYVIIDEFLALPFVTIGIAWSDMAWVNGLHLFAAFALFRIFDIRKPWLINNSQKLPGGWGVAIDDFLAALAACAVLHLGILAVAFLERVG